LISEGGWRRGLKFAWGKAALGSFIKKKVFESWSNGEVPIRLKGKSPEEGEQSGRGARGQKDLPARASKGMNLREEKKGEEGIKRKNKEEGRKGRVE